MKCTHSNSNKVFGREEEISMTIEQAKHIIEANYSMLENTLSMLMYDEWHNF